MFPVRTDEPIHTYFLRAEIPTEARPMTQSTGTLLVNLPRAQSGFNTHRMAYITRDHELNYFAVNQWAETPAHMLLPLLVKALEHTNQWDAVVQMPSPVRGNYQLISENLLLQHEFTQEPSRIRIHLRLQLIRVKNFHVLATREFTVLENAQSNDPYGGVQAANSATEQLLKEISEWVSLCRVEPTDKKC
ncbi:ABC-type transport auxiliary lipoprotein family protein [Candidatus Nitronereus thalassa]|uniref:ABC-type transport auxiliary lipoprotein family protein n=1 Tax=Candidatus Nitronereus thalassa TaxID=3020898 RepID=A0ABU3K8M5_9BACT|nr:ABC-type transport auxiliary lipoprotein family protein [Candidatus Nitronereus thalassa]MDT7042762.1 ABC-type transport auxiliary lipoprotein family protein [Candidatus Nitronereus thalassa]